MTRFRLFAAAAVAGSLAFAAPALAQGSPVLGTWTTEAKTDFGTFKSNWTVAEAGGAYTVDVTDAPMEGGPGGPPPESTISDVKVEANKLSFTRALKMEQGPMNLKYTVTVDGDTMSGEASSDFGPIPITGTRQ
jgi:hypothetical protein